MSEIKNIISELEKLSLTESIDVSGFFDFTQDYSYDAIRHFLDSLKNQTKPETAASELFREVVKDILKIKSFSEVNIGNGFIDFALKESVGNPILIELKPFFRLFKNGTQLRIEELIYTEHKDQILKYLKNNEYVLLTNLSTVYLFSRNAIIDFEPFQTISFTELLNTFLQYENLWDTIKRIEDQNIKIDLDKTFFEDLKNWYNEFKKINFIANDKLTNEELIVLLLNKIIFIKTLEDFGLIQFKHLTDEYLNKKDKWEAKGSERILTTFFNELEEYFDYFYDTELFKTRFWDYIDKDKKNLEAFQHVFETALGLDAWNRTFGRGMIHYNYRQIDEDIFGKAYETFIAENKKDSGVYYTPKEITQYMAKKLVDYLFTPLVDKILIAVDKDNPNYQRAGELLEELVEIKILDPASGSGSFLIKVLREIYYYYKKIDDATNWINKISTDNLFDLPATYQATIEFRKFHNFNDHLQLISKMILRHIYAVDIDERALETAKTNIWKEAIKLNPRIYNYKKLNGKSSHILPDLELNFICADSLADLDTEEQIEWLSNNCRTEIKRLYEIRKKYLSDPFDPANVDEALKIRESIYLKLKDKLPEINNPLFICLRYFFVYFDKNGIPLKKEERGFDGVISNPPWEEIYPVKKEFAEVGKYSLSKEDFEKEFDKRVKVDSDFKKGWEYYQLFYKTYTEFISNRYQYHDMKPTTSKAMRSHLNYFKIFFERGLEIIHHFGRICFLIPSSFQTDEGGFGLRKLAIDKYKLSELTSFENKGYIRIINGSEHRIKLFPDVHPQFKFSIVVLNKVPNNRQPYNFESKFYLTDPSDLTEKEPIIYNTNVIKKFSPNNLSIMEFRSLRDYEICLKIRKSHPLLEEKGFNIRREFNVSDDRNLFSKETGKNFIPVYEGKMIHQFNSNYSSTNYYIQNKNGRSDLLGKEVNRIKSQLENEFDIEEIKSYFEKDKFKLDYETFRLVYRAVGSSTNERTLISTIVPSNVFTVNSLNYLINFSYKKSKGKIVQEKIDNTDLLYIMSLFNSLTLNYYIRNKISANLNMFYIYELPIPKVTAKQKEYIANAAISLLVLNSEEKLFKELLSELKIKVDSKGDPIMLRAKLEVFIAKELFKLSKEDWLYITSTFVYGEKSETKQELDKFIAKSLEIF
ncbi:MAG: N-6 DNA methylase [Ignavibacteriaceae bacterium]